MTNQTQTQTNKDSYPFKLDDSFKPAYNFIINVHNENLGAIQRRSFTLLLPEKTLKSKSEVEKNIKFAINAFLLNKQNKDISIKATMIFVFSDNDKEMEYLEARAVFAPASDWSQAGKFSSYKENELKIDFFNGVK